MHRQITKSVADRFGEEIRFFKTWVDKPKAIGSVLPTSGATARRMASIVNPDSNDPVLELGPGTGIITRAILARGVQPRNLYAVEYTQEFIPQLRSDFPDVNIVHGDAFQLARAVPELDDQKLDSVVSGLPLLNFPVPQRIDLLNELFNRLRPGRPVVQFSYGPVSPIPPDWSTYSVEPFDWFVRNFPPARLWLYRRVITAEPESQAIRHS